ncbi:MAG: hypothetical protein PF549_02780 [Patescibacteria group bacterium]|nr:hypothetical protein [Patescibacteria group bacterium]
MEKLKKEFVILDKDKREIELVDPVIEFWEDDDYWYVDNGFNNSENPFTFRKLSGLKAIIRDRK